jgi:thiamine biosynthesis lipoprotein
MACPCTVLIDVEDRAIATELTAIAHSEALRVERAFSRYRTDNIVHAINNAAGRPVEVDAEAAYLLDYAATCWEMSQGRFDITSGVLRRVWTFDGGDRVPSSESIAECLTHVGWHRVRWEPPVLTMPVGMEIDLGGIGKEYAVDRAAALLSARTSSAFLVNFGGDLFANARRRGDQPWRVGIDDPRHTGEAAARRFDIGRAGVATSGDARRFVRWRGQRLGHILDPRTGWPVRGAPSSVTVIADSCVEAGTLSTLALLQGPGASAFLAALGLPYWVL